MTSIDVSKIYKAYCALPPSLKRPGTSFLNVKLLYNEGSSVVLGDKKHIVKIVSSHNPLAAVEKEFEMLRLCKSLHGKAFTTPLPIAYGKNPNYLVMTRLEKPCGYIPDGWDYSKVGRAIGEFAAELWTKHGLIYNDIHPYNFTQERDHRVGILDLASITEPRTRLWFEPDARRSLEEMFLSPMTCKPGLAPDMAEAFTARSGIPIDFAWAERLLYIVAGRMMGRRSPGECAETLRIMESNLQDWRARAAHSKTEAPSSACAWPSSRL